MATYKCGNCAYLETNGRVYYGKEYYCKSDGKTHKLDCSTCSNFVKDNDTRKAESGLYKRAGWYITTAIIEIFKEKYGKDCELLQPLYDIRTYLESSPEFAGALEEYDRLAPTIAQNIKQEADAEVIAIELTRSFLLPSVQKIKAGNMDAATTIYMNMFNMLKIKYNLVSVAIELGTQEQIKNFDRARMRSRLQSA